MTRRGHFTKGGLYMPENITINAVYLFLLAIMSFMSLAGGLIMTFRNIKKTSPGAEREAWQKEVDRKLDSDNRRIDTLERDHAKERKHRADFEKIVLRSLMEINSHLGMCQSNNNVDTMKAVNLKIEDFLLNQYET
jgi:hypothetical protein